MKKLNSKDNKLEKNEKENNKIDNSNLEEKGMSAEKLASIKVAMHINDIKNKNRNDGITSFGVPKKLNLKEIFKNMNIDQISSNIKAEKREEIIKYAQQTKEEEENLNRVHEAEQESEKNQELEKGHQENEKKDEPEGKDFKNEKGYNLGKCIDVAEDDKEKEEKNIPNQTIKEEESSEIKIKNDNIYDNITNEMHNESNNEGDEEKPKRKNTFNKLKNPILNNNMDNSQSKKEDAEENEEKTNIKRKLFDWDEETDDLELNENRLSTNYNKRKKSSMDDDYLESFKEKKSVMEKSKKHLGNTEQKTMRNTLQTSKSSIHFLTDKKKIKKINEIFLEMKNVSEEEQKNLKSETFCNCFFLASFPTENGKILEGSETDPADCNHPDCSKLPAMQPEIIYKYPQEDNRGLEINNLAASICFPNGIKLCYEEDKAKIKTVTNYRTSIINMNGERFFAVTYHFFLEMENNDFSDTYKNSPIRHQLSAYQDELTASFHDELEEVISEKLDLYSKLLFRDKVYIPFCLCLISKYPFYEQMEKCLETIMISINYYDNSPEELNQLINYVVKSIPIPTINSKISFALPHFNKMCEIQSPYFEDILKFGNDPLLILKHLSINNIILFFKLLLFEQKILVVGKDNDIISQIILNFVSLLYPFDWIHTNIPIMSEKMIKFLQAFLPFLNGMNINIFKKAQKILERAENVFIVNIDEDTINLNSYLKRNGKNIKASNYISKNFGNIPKNIENLLIKELKLIKNDYDKTPNRNNNKSDINIRINNLFFQVFIEILCDYEKYSHIIDNYPVFNSHLFINEKSVADKIFYKELTSTQLFQMFIQSSFSNEKKIYFDQRYKEYLALKEKGERPGNIYSILYEKYKKKYTSFLEIKNNYIIKPIILKNFKKMEKNYESENLPIKLEDINIFLSQEFDSYVNYLNSKGVLRENERIVGRPIKLFQENDPKNYTIFTFRQSLDTLSSISETSSQKKDYETNSEISIENSSSKYRPSFKMKIISGDGKNEENIRYSIYVRNKKIELTEEQIDEIKDTIRETMTHIYKSETEHLEDDKKAIMDCIQTQFGRDYFIDVLTSGNKKDNAIKTLHEDSFECFKDIIFNILLKILSLEENDKNILYAVKLTKICIYIKTYKNKKEILLSDEIFSLLDNYPIFKNKSFWKIWIEDGLTESDLKILKKIKKCNGDFTSIEENEKYKIYIENSFDIIDKLFSIMMKMKLSNSFIYSTITELGQEYIIDSDKFSILMKNLINEIYLLKKLSNK